MRRVSMDASQWARTKALKQGVVDAYTAQKIVRACLALEFINDHETSLMGCPSLRLEGRESVVCMLLETDKI
eukprot:5885581-Ditylum_brightwellii.AAC.1